jgi:hypothetical protein
MVVAMHTARALATTMTIVVASALAGAPGESGDDGHSSSGDGGDDA